ncbi:hypothetical protein [Fictibacillus enclensis]|uniref:hypothetical protein n=1 Tax=Fictibacillus enclensis TaxID=1017270 RepID=UPI0024C0499F|nr:hypothetical protein [Fictibacillus enclensis]WHY74040.1 hypothetical protein QNH15_09100 [Fictibacillus enclensis]
MSDVKKQTSLVWEKNRKQQLRDEKVINLHERKNEQEEKNREELRTEIMIETEGKMPSKVVYITSGFGKIAAGSTGSSPYCMAA